MRLVRLARDLSPHPQRLGERLVVCRVAGACSHPHSGWHRHGWAVRGRLEDVAWCVGRALSRAGSSPSASVGRLAPQARLRPGPSAMLFRQERGQAWRHSRSLVPSGLWGETGCLKGSGTTPRRWEARGQNSEGVSVCYSGSQGLPLGYFFRCGAVPRQRGVRLGPWASQEGRRARSHRRVARPGHLGRVAGDIPRHLVRRCGALIPVACVRQCLRFLEAASALVGHDDAGRLRAPQHCASSSHSRRR